MRLQQTNSIASFSSKTPSSSRSQSRRRSSHAASDRSHTVRVEVTVWLFRISGPSSDPVLTGHWIETNDAINAALKEAAISARDSVLEAHDYDLWAPQEDGQVLLLDANETFAGRVVDASADPLPTGKRKGLLTFETRNFTQCGLLSVGQR